MDSFCTTCSVSRGPGPTSSPPVLPKQLLLGLWSQVHPLDPSSGFLPQSPPQLQEKKPFYDFPDCRAAEVETLPTPGHGRTELWFHPVSNVWNAALLPHCGISSI